MNKYPGILIVFDGIDGAGKTTQVRMLESALAGIGENVVLSKEPTDGTWGKKLRESAFSGRLPFEEELDAFIRDRQEHLQTKIIPALQAGSVVILDRYFYSTIAYQGILVEDHHSIEERIRADVVVPDVAFWMDLPTEVAVGRVKTRDGKLNAFERQDDLEKAAKIFEAISKHDNAVVRIEATMPIPLLHKTILNHLVEGALKAKRCAKPYGCDDPVYCGPRMTDSCDWATATRRLYAAM
ncbi:dTMP kinase [Herbaspirillum sp. NPDC101396]|uniref:dTMP kinase n=1 Tax=Herbaspirillum sp. NPDC101396 TaxID=3364005 RepID=UPI00383BA280